MKKITLHILIVSALGVFFPLCVQGQYNLVWQDEFNGKELNKNYWHAEVNGNGGGNSELQYYKEENVSIGKEPKTGESCLILHAKKESYLGKDATSGRINSLNKISFKYGKLEARIKLPRTKDGIWPAFWLLGADLDKVGWPRSGEIDIMEMGNVEGIKNGTQDRFFNGACHWGFYQPGNWYPNHAKHITNAYDLQDDFHLYTLIWDNESLKMYVDMDKYPSAPPYFEMGIADYSSPIAVGHYFHKPFSILFNLAVGGNFTQLWDINKITAFDNGNDTRMYVDYVRLYQKGLDGEEFHGDSQSSIEKEENEQSGFYVYPNPTYSKFTLKGMDADSAEVYVTSTSGELMLSVFGVNEVDVSSLSQGNYIVLAIDVNKKVYSCLFIKR